MPVCVSSVEAQQRGGGDRGSVSERLRALHSLHGRASHGAAYRTPGKLLFLDFTDTETDVYSRRPPASGTKARHLPHTLSHTSAPLLFLIRRRRLSSVAVIFPGCPRLCCDFFCSLSLLSTVPVFPSPAPAYTSLSPALLVRVFSLAPSLPFSTDCLRVYASLRSPAH